MFLEFFGFFLDFFDFLDFLKFFGFVLDFFGFLRFLSKLLRLLLKLTMVTTGHKKLPKMGQNSIISPKGKKSLGRKPKPSAGARNRPA